MNYEALGFIPDPVKPDYEGMGFIPDKKPKQLEATSENISNRDTTGQLGKQESLPYQVANKILDGAKWLGEKYESYLTAPSRAAIGAFQKGKNPIIGFAGQFGNDPNNAPRGNKILADTGYFSDQPIPEPIRSRLPAISPTTTVLSHILPESIKERISQISPADFAGAGVDFLVDPLITVPPIFKLGKTAGSLGLKAAAGATKVGAEVTDALFGTKAATQTIDTVQKASEFGKASIHNVSEGLSKIFNPKQAEDFEQLAQTAQKYGIDPKTLPESVEYGKGTFLDSMGRAQREGVLNEHYMQQFIENYQKLQNGVTHEISQIGNGAPLAPLEAGVQLRKSFDEGMQRFWSGIDLTHDTVQQYAPGLYIDRDEMDKLNSVVNGIEKFAKGRATRGISAMARQQGAELLNAVDAFRSSNGSYKQAVEALRDIGEEAFSTQNIPQKVPADVKNLRKLYFAIDDALTETVRKHVNPDFATELKQNNELIHHMFEDKGQVGYILSNKDIAPEVAFRRIIGTGDSDQITALKKFLTPEQLNQQKAAFLNDMIKVDPDGGFSLKNLYGAMRNKKQQVENLFSDSPQQLQAISSLLRLGERFGNPILSTSGTGASNVFHNIGNAFKSGVANETLINSLKDKARNASQAAKEGLVPEEAPSIRFPALKSLQLLNTESPVQRRLQKK